MRPGYLHPLRFPMSCPGGLHLYIILHFKADPGDGAEAHPGDGARHDRCSNMAKDQEGEMDALKRLEFKRQLESLQKLSGRGTELISLYIPPRKVISDVVAYLRNELSQSSNIKSKSTRKNVMAAIESILSRLKHFKTPPETGVVIFVGAVPKPDNPGQTQMTQFVVEPPVMFTTFMYRCDNQFHLKILEDMLSTREKYALIVMDRKEATFGILEGKAIRTLKNVQSRVPSKHSRGGQSAQRFERLIEIAAHDYFKKLGDMATEFYLDDDRLQGIIIGGPGATKVFWAEKEYLHHELKKKVIDTFDTGYTDEFGLRELVENASKALAHLDIVKEKQLIGRLMAEIRKDEGGLAAYGEPQVRNALTMGAVDTLLVSEEYRSISHNFRCPGCDAKKSVAAKEGIEPQAPACASCGKPMKPEGTRDLMTELTAMAVETGADVAVVSVDSDDGSMFFRAFGGLAAILRFRGRGGLR